jgi:hypothetical protein
MSIVSVTFKNISNVQWCVCVCVRAHVCVCVCVSVCVCVCVCVRVSYLIIFVLSTFQKAKRCLRIFLLLFVVIINRAASECQRLSNCLFQRYYNNASFENWCDWQSEVWKTVEFGKNRKATLINIKTNGRLHTKTTLCSQGQRHCLEFQYAFYENNIFDLQVHINSNSMNGHKLLW